MKKILKIIIFIYVVSMCGCGKPPLNPSSNYDLSRLYTNIFGDESTYFSAFNERKEAFYKYFDGLDYTIVGKRCGMTGSNSYIGLVSNDYYYVLKHSVKYHYTYYAMHCFDGYLPSTEELYQYDSDNNVITYSAYYNGILSSSTFASSSKSIDECETYDDFLYHMFFRSFDYANPLIAGLVNEDDSQGTKDMIAEEYQDYLYIDLLELRPKGHYEFTTEAGYNVSYENNFPIKVTSNLVVANNNKVDIKYTVENNGAISQRISGEFSRQYYDKLYSSDYHIIFENDLPSYYSLKLYDIGQYTGHYVSAGYYEAVKINYLELPSDPTTLFGKNDSVSEESKLFRNREDSVYEISAPKNLFLEEVDGDIQFSDLDNINDYHDEFSLIVNESKGQFANQATIRMQNYNNYYFDPHSKLVFESKYTIEENPNDFVLSGTRGINDVIYIPNELRCGKYTIFLTKIDGNILEEYERLQRSCTFYIPKEIQYITSGSFSSSLYFGFEIYCEASSKPQGWADDWTNCENVHWGAENFPGDNNFKTDVMKLNVESGSDCIELDNAYLKLTTTNDVITYKISRDVINYTCYYVGDLVKVEVLNLYCINESKYISGFFNASTSDITSSTFDNYRLEKETNGFSFTLKDGMLDFGYSELSGILYHRIIISSPQITVTLENNEIIKFDNCFIQIPVCEETHVAFVLNEQKLNVKSISSDILSTNITISTIASEVYRINYFVVL